MDRKYLNIIKEYAIMTIGCLLYSISLNYFFISNHLAEGGATGICLIIHYIFKFPVSLTYLILNIPLLAIGWKLVGRQFLVKTLYGTICMSAFIALTSSLKGPTNDIMLAGIYGGLVAGIGLGLIFMVDGSTGGTDIVAMVMKKYFDIPIGRTMLIMDTIILSVAALIFGKTIVMYTLIAIMIVSKTVDYFQDGYKKSKGVTIISHKYEEIKNKIMDETGRGTHLIHDPGGYSRKDLPIVYCVASKFELSKIKNIVRDIDPDAFLTVSDVSEVLGEGFNPLKIK